MDEKEHLAMTFLTTLFLLASQLQPIHATPKATPGHIQFRPGSGVSLSSSDKQFRLVLGLRAQFLYEAGQEQANAPWQQGLIVRRARVKFKGHLFGKQTRFKVALGISASDLDVENGIPTQTPLRDWIVDFHHLRWLYFRIGQFKVAYSLSRLTSSKRFLFVDRSLVNKELELDRDTGIAFQLNDLFTLKRFQLTLTLAMGEGMGLSDISDGGLLYTARLQFQPLGALSIKTEDDLKRSPHPLLSLAVAYAFGHRSQRKQINHGDALPEGIVQHAHALTADLIGKWKGFSAVVQWMWREGSYEATKEDTALDDWIRNNLPRNGWGIFGHIAYLLPIPVPVSIGARIGHLQPTSDTSSEITQQNEAGAVVNVYFGGHSYKLQADYFFLFDAWSPSANAHHRVRLQLQMTL